MLSSASSINYKFNEELKEKIFFNQEKKKVTVLEPPRLAHENEK
jgi:hypothetical protein